MAQNKTNHNKIKYIKDTLLPCFVFSSVAGIFTGALIFLFKIASGFVIDISDSVYSFVRENPIWLPILIASSALVGLLASFILRFTKNCRGGGIPTSIAILRGLIEFKWLKSIFCLFASALLTFIGGVPLGTEGPSVQMGTAVGRGTSKIFGKKQRAWDRYIMTGGACGGFAVATGAPLAAIMFAVEEVHRRFSPLLFMIAAMSVSTSTVTMRLLCRLFDVSPYLFEFSFDAVLPLEYLWAAVVIGVVCGFTAILFTYAYSFVGNIFEKRLAKLPLPVKITFIFALVSVLGFASEEMIGSGHSLIDALMKGYGVWYLLLLCFCIRAMLLMFANRVGISGGIFVPTLAFGALIGALFSKISIQLGIFPEEYFVVPIIIGMAAFLAASSRIPITAMAFAIEAMSGLANSIPIAIGITLSFLIIEVWGIPSLQDMVIEEKTAFFNKGKTSTVVDCHVTVMPDSFAIGRDIRHILWPPTCVVLSVQKSHDIISAHEAGLAEEKDILHLHYQTFEPETTMAAIEAIVGEQTNDVKTKMHTVNQNNHLVPDL